MRTFSWYDILSETGLVNAILSWISLGPYTMLNTSFGTVVRYLTLTLPLVLILQTLALANIDRNLIQAAHNLGCSPARAVWTVIIPSAKTGLIVAALFCFILSFGDFVASCYLGGSKPHGADGALRDGDHSPQAEPDGPGA